MEKKGKYAFNISDQVAMQTSLYTANNSLDSSLATFVRAEESHAFGVGHLNVNM